MFMVCVSISSFPECAKIADSGPDNLVIRFLWGFCRFIINAKVKILTI